MLRRPGFIKEKGALLYNLNFPAGLLWKGPACQYVKLTWSDLPGLNLFVRTEFKLVTLTIINNNRKNRLDSFFVN